VPREVAGAGIGREVGSVLLPIQSFERGRARVFILLLLQILLDPFRLASEIRDVLVVGVDEALQVAQVLLELFGELQVFLVAPGAAERVQLRGQRRRPIGQVLVELLEHLGEEPQLAGIDNGLSHGGFRGWGLGIRGPGR